MRNLPRTLAVETSGSLGSLALLQADGTLDEVVSDRRASDAPPLFQRAADLLAKRSLRPSDLELIAVGIGPGSFTGMRMALTFARTLAFAVDRPLVGFSSLEVLANEVPLEAGVVGVMEPAHAGHVYAASFEARDGGFRSLLSPTLCAIPDALAAFPDGSTLTGRGVPDSEVDLPKRGFRRASSGTPTHVRAETLARLAAIRWIAGECTTMPETAEPLYLQASAPERKST